MKSSIVVMFLCAVELNAFADKKVYELQEIYGHENCRVYADSQRIVRFAECDEVVQAPAYTAPIVPVEPVAEPVEIEDNVNVRLTPQQWEQLKMAGWRFKR